MLALLKSVFRRHRTDGGWCQRTLACASQMFPWCFLRFPSKIDQVFSGPRSEYTVDNVISSVRKAMIISARAPARPRYPFTVTPVLPDVLVLTPYPYPYPYSCRYPYPIPVPYVLLFLVLPFPLVSSSPPSSSSSSSPSSSPVTTSPLSSSVCRLWRNEDFWEQSPWRLSKTSTRSHTTRWQL